MNECIEKVATGDASASFPSEAVPTEDVGKIVAIR